MSEKPGDLRDEIERLTAALEESEQRVRELEADPDRPTVTYAGDELEACEAALERAERDAERLRLLIDAGTAREDAAEARVQKAEARAEMLLSTLRAILEDDNPWPIARKAITAYEGDKP